MYRTSAMILSARLSAVDSVHRISHTLFASADRLLDLYAETGRAVLETASRHVAGADAATTAPPAGFAWWSTVPVRGVELLASHIEIARQARETIFDAALTQGRAHRELARRAVDLGSDLAPPEVELAIKAAASTLVASLEAVDELAQTTAKTAGDLDAAVARVVTGATSNGKRRRQR